jgi:hypothetical protein
MSCKCQGNSTKKAGRLGFTPGWIGCRYLKKGFAFYKNWTRICTDLHGKIIWVRLAVERAESSALGSRSIFSSPKAIDSIVF